MKLSLTTRAADPSRTRRATAMVVSAALAVGAVAVLSAPAAIAAVHTLRSAAAAPITGQPPSAPVQQTGTLPDGATWLVEKPANWNGTLVLYGHGMVAPGEDNPAKDAPDPITGKYLLDNGYALAGSSYATTGFAMEQAMQDQADLVGVFAQEVAPPTTTIAWGTSLGGMVTAGLLERHPELFDGGLAMCGPLAGGVGLMDSYLDTVFALKTLLAPDVSLVHLGEGLFDQIGALQAARGIGTGDGRGPGEDRAGRRHRRLPGMGARRQPPARARRSGNPAAGAVRAHDGNGVLRARPRRRHRRQGRRQPVHQHRCRLRQAAASLQRQRRGARAV